MLMQLIFVLLLLKSAAHCPDKCTCKKIGENSSAMRVKCNGSSQLKLTSLKDLNFADDFENIVQLDLSNNQISLIEKEDFINYTNLRRLDLSHNSLKQVDDSVFGEQLGNLERLKLSTNMIVHIHQGSFEGLKQLKQLDISNNPLACDCDLVWLVAWSNEMSVKLQPTPKCETPIDFKGTLLKKLKVGSDLHCESPFQPLLELKPAIDQLVFEGDEVVLRCRAPRVAVGSPSDSEDLPARAHVFWGWSDKIIEPNSTDDVIYRDPIKYFPSIEIDAKHLSDSGLLDSILRIPEVTLNHSGMWDCRLRSQQANLSRTISIIVISEDTRYCDAIEIRNNKGKYFWPRTIRGKLVRQPCAGEASNSNVFSTYFCNENGEWINLNIGECPFISETTRILEQFAKVNLTVAKGSVLESAKRLKNFTHSSNNLRKIRDPVDVVFIAKTLRNYLTFIRQENDLGSMILDIVSQILMLPELLHRTAQELDNTGTQIVDAVEIAAQYTPYTQFSSYLQQFADTQQTTHKSHLSVDYFKIRIDSFTGMSCTWFHSEYSESQHRTFQCNTVNQSFDIFGQNIDASIQISANFLYSQHEEITTHKLMVAVYENGNLFPYISDINQTSLASSSSSSNQLKVTSVIIGAKIISETENLRNVSEPVSVMLRVRPYHDELSAPIPAWWDDETNLWNFQACQTSYHYRGLLIFTCTKLGYYGLLQNRIFLNDFIDENAGAQFRYSPIGIYIGSCVVFICAWINIVNYVIFRKSIQMARRQRHSLVNTWLAISALSFVFAVGIYQTEDLQICRIIGILIHYLSLCVILWVCVSVSNMYKRLSKRNRLPPTDDGPKENIGSKPILGIYLVGWGIGMIICGISGAVNMREYASYSFCFLSNGPALSALFVPATVLLLFLSILFICVRCHISTTGEHHGQGQFSEHTQGTENVDLELLEPNMNGASTIIQQPHLQHHFSHSDRYRSLTLSSPTTSILDDMEHTYIAQLRAYLVFLFLYIILWILGASSIVSPLKNDNIDFEKTFSVIFAIISSTLGIFLLVFYSTSRTDIRYQWNLLKCRNCFSQGYCRSRNISDGSKELNTIVTYHQTCGTVNSGSRSNSQCSKNRPSSARSNQHKSVDVISGLAVPSSRIDSPSKLISSQGNFTSHGGGGGGNVSNVSSINRQTYSTINNPVIMTQEIPNADFFYNPNQINVARKFFKKQKRLAKRNNFELQRQMDRCEYGDGSISEICSNIGGGAGGGGGGSVNIYSKPQQTTRTLSMFSTGSKVNNTNIHVRNDIINTTNFSKESRHQNLNPNILSDSCNESDMVVDAENFRLLKNHRAKMNINNHSEMIANIYTNVPETSQPLHEMVTMRADDKFRKSTNVENIMEQDEIDLERNDLSSHSEKVSSPFYVNGNIINITTNNSNRVKNENNAAVASPARVAKSSSQFHDENLRRTTAIYPSHNDSKPNPIDAMNTNGLPTAACESGGGGGGGVLSNENISASFSDDHEEHNLALSKDETYVSETLQITDRIYLNENFSAIRITSNNVKKSKSLISLARATVEFNKKTTENYSELPTRSISYNDFSQIPSQFQNKSSIPKQRNPRYIPDSHSESPILFSPSLCDMNNLPSPIDRRKPIILGSDKSDIDAIKLLEAACSSNSSSRDIDPNQQITARNLDSAFTQSFRRNFASSPAGDSDLHYQNSELSIRSHGLYAPQPDNDMNLTLIGDPYYLYQSSEVSESNDFDNENDFDDFNNCSNDCLLPFDNLDRNESHTSLDDLYEAITRGGTDAQSPPVNFHLQNVYDCPNSIRSRYQSSENLHQSTQELLKNPNSVSNKSANNSKECSTGSNAFDDVPLKKENCGADAATVEIFEDDSSQSSIISYIDPNGRLSSS